MTLVDSHCHLDDGQFDADREAAIERARAAGIAAMLAIGTGGGPPDLEAGIRLADAHPDIYATVGVHPHDAAKATEETFERLAGLLRHPKVLGVGEIGLDYHYDLSPREAQRDVFARQVALARETAKPVIIHTREAWADTLAILGEGPGILHCFSEGPEEAARALERGFHISFTGMVTFPRAESVQAAARMVPVDRLLVETDAPYLAPVPRRGKRNEPAFVVETVRRLAELRNTAAEEIAAATTANFRRLFGLD
ncbi:MAG TPA: TatD family hydrolase [Bryobacteraceae bacterium]|nr:TatD family hydrolase [Bryobacteraceae bacterium]